MIIYEYDTCVSQTSNNSRTDRIPILFGSCGNSLGFNEEIDCLDCFCQPYIDGDKFIYQIQTDVFQSTFESVVVVNGVEVGSVELEYTSLLTNFGAFVNIEFDMDVISLVANSDCFKVNIVMEDSTIFESTTFCRLACDEPSFLISSDYKGKDCNGTIYSYSVIHNASGGTIPYSNSIRFKGDIELRSIAIENTYEEINTTQNDSVVHTKSKLIDQFDLRVWGVPEWQIKILKSILGGLNLKVIKGNREYSVEVKGSFDKGPEKGNLWYPTIKLEKICTKILNNC